RVTLKAAASVARGTPIVLQPAHLGSEFVTPSPAIEVPRAATPAALVPPSLREATLEFQRTLIRRTLAEHGGNWAAAARALDMHRGNLHHLASRLGLR
ncbi:MAG TPA: helix-turn-helix domain-containing protein, partial [Candidatus Acidoferrales bacterium]|nr:helix-turn-helix domain-containing protein [Candidatus Acidoferrales bacterium]